MTFLERTDNLTTAPSFPPNEMARTKAAVPKSPPTLDTSIAKMTTRKFERNNVRRLYIEMANETTEGPSRYNKTSPAPVFIGSNDPTL